MIAGLRDVLGRFRSEKTCSKMAAVSNLDPGWRWAVPCAGGNVIVELHLGACFRPREMLSRFVGRATANVRVQLWSLASFSGALVI